MDPCRPRVIGEPASDFFVDALTRLERGGLEYLMGGAFAFSWYSKVARETKDLDIFVRRDDVARALELLSEAGYQTELPFPHWLGKVHCRTHSIDIIFSSGNGVARVDDLWFERAEAARILGRPMRLCPPEELIWSKAFVQERERFDGADVLHLFRERGPALDWAHLLTRFADHWRVLFSHIVLFGFAYPDQRQQIPSWVVATLAGRLALETPEPDNRVCYGTLLSRQQYLWDIEQLGYRDARVEPEGLMTRTEAEIWTAAIGDRKNSGGGRA
jgi:hypothetical protein